ncbi:MAG: dephospho-CoA kinase [Bacteroidales bacterium]|jgi:dephospho-CoA kinase|nr:dephospho-CoA kinase [Bacteroidales bacterium]
MKVPKLSIGLTGGIGSGKTLIARAFMEIGAPVFFSDIEAKECYNDWEFVQLVAKEISPTIIEDGKLSKQALAKIIFSDKAKRELLNKLVHPKVLSKYNNWFSQQTAPYVIMESAILFEIDWQQHFDKVICVKTPQEIAVERIIHRDNITEEEALERMSAQLPTATKVSLSDYIIEHDNQTMLLPQILNINNEILKLINKENN